MIDFFKKYKTAIGGGLALLALIYVYLAFFSGNSSSPTLSSSETSPLSNDILVTLQSIHSITLDGSIFSDPVFVSLSDFGVTIPLENVGRRNPFAPIGVSSAPKSATSSSSGTH